MKNLFIIFICVFLVALNANADFILSAPPREKPNKGVETYEPIASYLSEILGERVVYEHPKHWTEYANNMRAGKYDFVFDGPHFSAWRIKHLDHVPLVRLPGNLQFYIVVNAEDSAKNMMDLLGSEICGLASPHLGTMSVFALYKNPVVQPYIRVIHGNLKKVYQAFKKGQCRAAVVRDFIYKKLPEDERQALRIVGKSKPLPNQTITVSRRLSDRQRSLIVSALTSKAGAVAGGNLLKRFSKRNPVFIAAEYAEYEGSEKLIEDVVWGW
jgi:ABC-type phosphate/phosphonate transport system substrate-binding protein